MTRNLDALIDHAEAVLASARSLRDLQAAYEAQFKGFHRGSKSREVAEYLIANQGEWVSSRQIAEWVGVSRTTVPVVARRLTANGVPVERRLGPKGEAQYRIAPEPTP